MSTINFKKSLVPVAAAALIALAGCGPSPNAQTAAAPAAAATAPAPVAAAPAPAPAPVAAPPPVAAAPEPTHHKKSTQVAQAEQPAQVQQPVQQAAPPPPPPPVCSDCGVIASVQDVRQKGDAGMVGTLGGGAVGGLLGNQFGHGKGKTAMTVLGAVGGAFAGREVQSQVTAKTVHQVTVNMDDGSQRTVTVDSLNGLGVGSKVKVEGQSLQYNGN